jgi:regulator of sigma E protease
MTVILAFLFVIGILVFIHELGHFLVAKWSGVRVEKFSLGFGKKILGFRRGETEYLISVLPLGGYVKMYGEGGEGNFIVDYVEPGSPSEKAGFKPGDKILSIDGIDLFSFSKWRQLESALREHPEKEYTFVIERDEKKLRLKSTAKGLDEIKAFSEKEYTRSFSNQSAWNRFKIVVAGPFMNLALPFLLLPIVFILGISVPAYLERPPVIGYVEPNSTASTAGFQKGDKILEVNGESIKTWKDANIAFQSNPDSLLNVKVERNGEIKTLELKASSSPEGITAIGLGEPLEAKVGSVVDGTPAERAGLKKGDKIVSINGTKISDWYQMAFIIREKANQELTLLVERGAGNRLEIKITPESLQGNKQGAIGITPYRDEIIKKYGFFKSIFEGIKEAGRLVAEITVLLFSFLYKLITGKISLGTAGKSIAGPIFIAKVSGSAAQSGLPSLLQFMAFISINLGLINLFPIPMLDGGHVLYLAIESIRRRPLSQRTLEISQRIGLTFLIFIMFLAIYNDLSRLKGSIIESLSRLLQTFR